MNGWKSPHNLHFIWGEILEDIESDYESEEEITLARRDTRRKVRRAVNYIEK